MKGSGWDLAAIEPVGLLPAVRLEPLLTLEQLEQLTDEAMVNYLRGCLYGFLGSDAIGGDSAPRISSAKYIDRTHAADVLALVDQENGDKLRSPGLWRSGRLRTLYHAGILFGQGRGERISLQSRG